MRKVREVILVEGRYDKNTLLQVVDATVMESQGFGIFNDRQKQKLLRSLAEKRGLIILTDSDGAGFVIRNFVRSCVDPALVKHAYIPDRYGKEKRKRAPSREGKLGVEGMPPQVLLEALERAGASFEDEADTGEKQDPITRLDLYRAGLSGAVQHALLMRLRNRVQPEGVERPGCRKDRQHQKQNDPTLPAFSCLQQGVDSAFYSIFQCVLLCLHQNAYFNSSLYQEIMNRKS